MTQHRKSPFRAYNLRKWSQAVSLAAFLILLIYLDPLTSAGSAANNLFLRLSPLSGLGASVAAGELITQYWPALILVAMTLLMGRFFCGWVCPFGTTIDLADKLFERRRADGHSSGWKIYDGRRLKYYLLAFILLSLFLSRQMAGWFDPLSLATNTYAILIHPYLIALLAGIFDFLHGFPLIGPLTVSAHELSDKILFVEREPFFRNHTAFVVIFLGIVSFGLVYRRYWCRNLCPLGAILALTSISAYLQRRVKDCEVCGLCQKGCRMGCITEGGKGTLAGECILCMDCQEVCPSDAIRFRGSGTPQLQEVDLSKRGLVTACLAGVAAVPMLGFNFPWRSGKGHGVIRPPGSVDEQGFLAKCIRCGECMKVCKTNGLHPTLLEAGLEAAWTPRLIPRIGHCDHTCTLCTHVCPSGAIQPLELPEKQKTAIGRARIDRSRCIPWVGYAGLPALKKDWHDVNCGVCEEVCPVPTKAIHFNTYTDKKGREIRRPFVREEVCNGCGFCEYACPVVGRAAIVVEGIQPQLPVRFEEPAGGGEGPFPEVVGEWTMLAGPQVYAGENGLYEYIDGAAEPYLSYSYRQVTVTRYGDVDGRKVLVEAWTFATTDDAFGAYSYDRSGAVYDLGDEATVFENYVWVWKGRQYIRLEPGAADIALGDVVSIAQAVIETLPPGESSPPALLSYLPAEGLDDGRTRFFHKKIVLDNIYLSDEVIDGDVFGLGEETDAVVAEYVLEEGRPAMKLLLIEYPAAADAHGAWERLVNLRKSPGESPLHEGALQCFEDKGGCYTTVYSRGRFLVAAFMAPGRIWAEDYTRAAAAKIPSK